MKALDYGRIRLLFHGRQTWVSSYLLLMKGDDKRLARDALIAVKEFADVAKLVYALDLGSSGATRESSSLSVRTILQADTVS